jgi:hypothetical protein
MEHSDITTEELHLVLRVLDCLADLERGEEVSGHVLAAAAELVRIAYRARTIHDPLPGQHRLDLDA